MDFVPQHCCSLWPVCVCGGVVPPPGGSARVGWDSSEGGRGFEAVERLSINVGKEQIPPREPSSWLCRLPLPLGQETLQPNCAPPAASLLLLPFCSPLLGDDPAPFRSHSLNADPPIRKDSPTAPSPRAVLCRGARTAELWSAKCWACLLGEVPAECLNRGESQVEYTQ